MHNPIANIKESDYDKVTKVNNQTRNDDPRFMFNSLTRSILCKKNGDLTDQDLIDVKYFLKEKSTVGIFHNYMDAIRKFCKEFHWGGRANNINAALADNEKCIRHHFRTFIAKRASHYSSMSNSMNMDLIHDLNFHDSNLYSDYFAAWNSEKKSMIKRNTDDSIIYLSYIILAVCVMSVYLFTKGE